MASGFPPAAAAGQAATAAQVLAKSFQGLKCYFAITLFVQGDEILGAYKAADSPQHGSPAMPEGFGVVSFDSFNLNFQIDPASVAPTLDTSTQDPTQAAPDAGTSSATQGAPADPPPADPAAADPTDPAVGQDLPPDAPPTDPGLDLGAGPIVVGDLPVLDHVAHFAGGDWVAL